jgi:predicted RND superfamily exporter protein
MDIKSALITAVMRHPYWMMAINLLLAAVISAGILQLRVDAGIDIFFNQNDPNLLDERALIATYGREDNILFVLDAGEAPIFTRQHLSTIEDLTARAWRMPNAKRVNSITNYLHAAVDGDDITVSNLLENVTDLSDADLARAQEIAYSREELRGRLLARNGQVAAINVSLNLPLAGKAAATAESVEYARQMVADTERDNPGLEVHLAGLAMTDQTLAEVTARDSATLMPLLLMIIVALCAFLLRSPLASLCIVLIIFLSILVGMGFAGWAGIGLNSVTASAPTIIMTLAIADCIHVLTVFLGRLRQHPDKHAALTHALDDTFNGVVLTSVTTFAGFLSMNFSESPPFGGLGNIAAIGVMGALWLTLTVLPGLVMLLPFRATKGSATVLSMDGLANFAIRNHGGLFWGALLLSILLISGISRIELNDDPMGYFSESVPLTHAMRTVEERLSGTQTLHYSFNAGEPGGIHNPEFLSQVDQFVAWLRAQPEVVNAESFTDTLRHLNQVMHGDAPEWRRLPDSSDLAAQYTLLYEISVPYGQDVTHQMSADKSSLKVSATLRNQKSQGLIAFEKRGRAWMEENIPDYVTRGVGQSISFAHVGLRNIDSMITGSLFALLMISGLLALAFRSVRFGIVSLIPNLIPALATLGMWGVLVGEVNIAASVVFSVTLGIIVDDTTHFLLKYIEGRRKLGLGVEESIRRTFNAVGNALFTTSILLGIGFLVLALSDFSVNSTTGLLVAITIFVAIFLDLLFLPAILMKADRLLFKRSPVAS